MKPAIRRSGWTVVCFLVLALPLGCKRAESSATSSSSNEAKPIVLGATLPLTGDAAVWGRNTQKGIELALAEINAAGGVLGRKLQVVYEDTQALAREGVSAYRKLVATHRVPVIIDDSVSSVTLAMAPLAQKDSVVILATGATAPAISDAGAFIFRIWNSDAYEGKFAARYAYHDLKHRTASILFINNDYGKGLEQVFKAEFARLGGRVTGSEGFAQSSTNLRTQLTKIKGQNPDVLYVVGYPKETPIALKQARELGLDVPVLGTVAMKDPLLIETAANAAEGLMFPFPKDSSGDHVERFQLAFREKYGTEPGITADVGYDAVKMIAEAIERTEGTSGDAIRRGLNMLKNYPGVSGTMTFDENGDVQKSMAIMIVGNQEFDWKE